MNRELQKFIPRIVKFTFPYFILSLFTIYMFYRSGEIFSVKKNIAQQIGERKNVIYGTAYSNLPRYFKFAATEMIQPTVLALGSSRVVEFRSRFFNDSVSFYSAGGVFKRIEQLRAFLEVLPAEDLPQSILLGVDQWWFCTAYEKNNQKENDLVFTNYSWREQWRGIEQWQKFYYDWWDGKISFKKIFSNYDSSVSYSGISAIMLHQGFRKDGSRSYGTLILNRKEFERRLLNSVDSVEAGLGIMSWCDAQNPIDRNSVNELRLLLRYCSKHNITVTGFIPPVHSLLLSEMKKQSEHFEHFFKLMNVLYPIFRDYNFKVYDFTNTDSFGSNDDEMLDGVHGGEKAYLKLYLQLLRKDIYLNQFSDSTELKEVLSQHKNRYEVFGNN